MIYWIKLLEDSMAWTFNNVEKSAFATPLFSILLHTAVLIIKTTDPGKDSFNIDYRQTYRYIGKHVEGNIKNSFYICIKLLKDVQRRVKNVPRWHPHYDILRTSREHHLTHFIKFLTITFLKYSFSVPPGSKNNWVYPMSHNIWRDVPKTP